MGDADVAQNMAEDPELASILDEALMEVDDEMKRLFSFINFLHSRTSQVMSQMSRCQKFSDCFTALNLLVTPITLAIGIAYVTAGMFTTGSATQVAVDTLVTILMYVSVSLGLPLYLFTLVEVFLESESGSASRTESGLSLLESVEGSLETVVQFRAQSRVRQSSSELGEELSEGNIESEESAGFEDTPAAFNNRQVKSANQQLMDLDMENFLDATTRSDTSQKDGNDACFDMTLIILNGCEDHLSVEVAKNDGGNCLEMEGTGIRDIPIQNAGKGNSYTSFEKNFVEIYQTGQAFGL